MYLAYLCCVLLYCIAGLVLVINNNTRYTSGIPAGILLFNYKNCWSLASQPLARFGDDCLKSDIDR